MKIQSLASKLAQPVFSFCCCFESYAQKNRLLRIFPQETEDYKTFRGTTLIYDRSYTLRIRTRSTLPAGYPSHGNGRVPSVSTLTRFLIISGCKSGNEMNRKVSENTDFLASVWNPDLIPVYTTIYAKFRTAARERVPPIPDDVSHQPASL